MASGKRASMREGPLAALFRKTETEGLEDAAAAPRAAPRSRAPRAAARPAPAPAPRRGAARADAAGAAAPRVLLRPAREHDVPARGRRRRGRVGLPVELARPSRRPAQPLLRVVGVGGGGVNAVNRMIEAEIPGVEFLAFNTDAQSLQSSDAHVKLQLGAEITRGLGSGSEPRPGARRRDGGLRPDQDAAARLGHGVHHRRRGRRHRHGRRARGGADRPRARAR